MSMKRLLSQIKQCRLCENILPFEPNPILQISNKSKVLILGQAPGAKTHQKSITFDDKSGDRLRIWLGVDKSQFYDEELFAILPMGFCYPGRGKSGDLPPTPQCAKTWREALLAKLTNVELTILLGKYSIEWHLHSKAPITELAKQWLIIYRLPDTCSDTCLQSIEAVHNSYVLLGKDMPRVTPVILKMNVFSAEQSKQLGKSQWQVIALTPHMKQQLTKAEVLISDPLGNIILTHQVPASAQQQASFGKAILADMKKLLKYSKAG